MTEKENPETVPGSGPLSEVHERNRALRASWLEASRNANDAAAAGDVDTAHTWQLRADAIANEFVKANWGLARAGARAFLHTDAEDHTAAGLLGLWEAFVGTQPDRVGHVDDVDGQLKSAGWDPSAGTFATYSRAHIQGRAARSVAALESRWQGKSYTTFSKAPAVHAAVLALEEEGVPVSVDAVAAKAGVSVDVARAVLAPAPVSFDAPVGEDSTLADIIPDKVDDFVMPVSDADVSKVASKLPVMDVLTLCLRHGLHGTRPRTMIRTADLLFTGRGAVMNSGARVETVLRIRSPRRVRAVVDNSSMRVSWDSPRKPGATYFEVSVPEGRSWRVVDVTVSTTSLVNVAASKVRVTAVYEDGSGSSTLVLDDSNRVK